MGNESRMRKYGPWALVTGASDGIGRAMAFELARSGLSLVLVARRQAVLESFAKELEQGSGVLVRVIAADLSLAHEVERVCMETRDLDVGLLVAAAGYGLGGKFQQTPLADDLDMLDVNCRAVLWLTKIFAERFAKRGAGGIILMSSIVAFQGVALASNYAATKAYIQSLAEGLRTELSPLGIDVLSCAPGPVRSGFAARAGMQLGQTVDPSTVAQEALRALGRQTTVSPGLLSKVLVGSLSLLPRQGRIAIMSRIMMGMTRQG